MMNMKTTVPKVIAVMFAVILTSPGNIIKAQNVGIGSVAFTPLSMLDVKGSMVVGSGYAGVSTAPANGMLVQGNVGIGVVSPTEQLHITGNFRLGGAFMPNNLPGSSGQVLTSQGA